MSELGAESSMEDHNHPEEAQGPFKFGCYFAQHFRVKYEKIENPPECTKFPGFRTLTALNQHVDRWHSPKERCKTCMKPIDLPPEKKDKKAWKPHKCISKHVDEVKASPEKYCHILTTKQQENWDKRAKGAKQLQQYPTGRAKWEYYFSVLLPDVPKEQVPDPEYNYFTLTHRIVATRKPIAPSEAPPKASGEQSTRQVTTSPGKEQHLKPVAQNPPGKPSPPSGRPRGSPVPRGPRASSTVSKTTVSAKDRPVAQPRRSTRVVPSQNGSVATTTTSLAQTIAAIQGSENRPQDTVGPNSWALDVDDTEVEPWAKRHRPNNGRRSSQSQRDSGFYSKSESRSRATFSDLGRSETRDGVPPPPPPGPLATGQLVMGALSVDKTIDIIESNPKVAMGRVEADYSPLLEMDPDPESNDEMDVDHVGGDGDGEAMSAYPLSPLGGSSGGGSPHYGDPSYIDQFPEFDD